MFELSMKEAEELESIEKIDVVKWYKMYLQQSSPKCRRLAVHVWGCNSHTDLKGKEKGKEGETETKKGCFQVIKDLPAFKKSSKFYPSFC